MMNNLTDEQLKLKNNLIDQNKFLPLLRRRLVSAILGTLDFKNDSKTNSYLLLYKENWDRIPKTKGLEQKISTLFISGSQKKYYLNKI